MCANVNPPASTSPFASSGRSFLSRLTSPLKSRTRNLTDFHIRPDEPHRQYSPGDLVKGAVVLTVVKPIRITHLTVCLHGRVRVYKNPNGANEPVIVNAELAAAGDPRKTQYFGNGHASLFQDESTLCGEGRLEAGIYEFNFELEFPRKGLPTSIDFERGSISYLITATVTRPTSIAATSSCDQKVNLVETVDIGSMIPPKPRTISLEPISRRSKRKKMGKNKEIISHEATDLDLGSEPLRGASSPLPDDSASQCGSLDNSANPRSPTASDIQSIHSAATSTDSTVSSSTGLSFRLGPVPSSAKSVRCGRGTSSKASLSEKTITATIELLKSGCLAGDNLPLKISIKHSKAMKSMHGIIITLYRQGRIDSAPPLSLFTDIKGKQAEKLKHEEYYPKSKTGLGGLSLTSAGSSSVFRKDLAQTFAPLLIDPTTLTAIISASIRVPEDVFPTISGVPGQMINFKYMVEVVVDLGGKLAGQQRHISRVGAVTSLGPTGARLDANPNMLAAWGSSIVDTDHIRREKSVVACVFEVVVGSTDSARKRGRGNSSAKRPVDNWPGSSPASPTTRHDPIYEEEYPGREAPDDSSQQNPYPYYEYPYNEEHLDYYDPPEQDYNQDRYYPHGYPWSHRTHINIPPPDLQTNEGLSEKEQIRLAEERLLPSQPPPALPIHVPSSSRTTIPQLAIYVPIEAPEDDLYSADSETPQGPSAPPPFPSNGGFSAPSNALQGPSVPSLEDLHPSASAHPADDKQELERRRLLEEASAPTEFVPDGEENADEVNSGRHQHEPSAPVLTEEDEYGSHYHRDAQPGPSTHHDQLDELPRYER